MAFSRKRHRTHSSSSSSPDADDFSGAARGPAPPPGSTILTPHDHRGGHKQVREVARDPSLSPIRRYESELDTSDVDGANSEPARKRRRGIRRSLERMGLDARIDELDQNGSVNGGVNPLYGNPTGHDTLASTAPSRKGQHHHPTTGISPPNATSSLTNNDDAKPHVWIEESPPGERIGFEDLGSVMYPHTVETPLEDKYGSTMAGSRWPGQRGSRGAAPDGMASSSRGQPSDFISTSGAAEPMQSEPVQGQRGKKRTWYEPEKDRVVVTSLSDSDEDSEGANRPVSNSGSTRTNHYLDDDVIDLDADGYGDIIELPASQDDKGEYHQPGAQGFTISPSLLSRLNHMSQQQRSELERAWNRKKPNQMILYRALPGLGDGPGGMGESQKTHSDHGAMDMQDAQDASRFEEIPDQDEGSMEVDDSMDDGGGGMEVDDMDVS